MGRRKLLKTATLVTTGAELTGCKKTESTTEKFIVKQVSIEWKMVTAWPKNIFGLGTGVQFIADAITEISGGRL